MEEQGQAQHRNGEGWAARWGHPVGPQSAFHLLGKAFVVASATSEALIQHQDLSSDEDTLSMQGWGRSIQGHGFGPPVPTAQCPVLSGVTVGLVLGKRPGPLSPSCPCVGTPSLVTGLV